MERLRFDFAVKSAADGKSNFICVTSIATPEGKVFEIPSEYQPVYNHESITKTSHYLKIKKTLTKRHQTRKIWITMTDEISKVYLDDDLNLQFHEVYLEQILDEQDKTKSSSSNIVMEELLKKLLEEKQMKTENKNLRKIGNDFIIEKFDSRNSNAYQWIQDFNNECERFQIIDDKEKIEILKFFMEHSSVDWYSCMMMKLTIESAWEKWEKSFCETFGNKGWTPIRYALSYKYQAGSLLEYALKKEKLLLEVRKSIDTGTLIDLIAFGLPNYVSDNINREILQGTEDLYNEIGKLEHLVRKDKYEKKNTFNNTIKTKQYEDKKPCSICMKEKKGKRYHSENDCWFKSKDKLTLVRTVNNSELEVELNEENPKN